MYKGWGKKQGINFEQPLTPDGKRTYTSTRGFFWTAGMLKRIVLVVLVGALIVAAATVTFGCGLFSSVPLTWVSPDRQQAETQQDATGPSDYADYSLSHLKLPILMYHHIRDVADQSDALAVSLSLPVSMFSEQLDFIEQQGYQTVTFADVLDGTVPSKAVMLTFDDGYDDIYTYAYPELKKRGMTAVLFLIGHDLDTGGYLTSDQVREMVQDGLEIASHTLSHPDLRDLDETRLQAELAGSKAFLEERFGVTVASFCYPSGRFSDDTVSAVRDAGYRFAVTTRNGEADFASPEELNRYRIGPTTTIGSLLK